MRRAALWLAVFAPLGLLAFEYRPWYSEPLLPLVTLAYQFQTFPRVQTEDSSLNRREIAHTGRGTLSFSPTDEINGQAEVALTGTTANNFFFDYAALAVRYLLLNDVIGDSFSLSVGGALFVPSTTSRRDFATPHLGPVNFEAHAAIGKERAWSSYWCRRVWAVAALVASTQGSPAIWAKFAIAFNQCDRWYIEGFSIGLLGLGTRDLSARTSFEGYGPYATRAVDVGIRVASCRPLGTVRVEYRYRPYAHNYPQKTHFVVLSVLFPLAI